MAIQFAYFVIALGLFFLFNGQKNSNNNNCQFERYETHEQTNQDGLPLIEKLSPETISLWKQNAVRKAVAIIGGGVAGMGALKIFLENKFDDVILLEAQEQLGGRIKTFRDGAIHVEDGAEWIHGNRGNVLFDIAEQLGQLMDPIAEDAYDFRVLRQDGSSHEEDVETAEIVSGMLEDALENGVLKDFYNVGYGQYFLHRFEKEISRGEESDVLKAWLHFLEQTVNSEEGTECWNSISAEDADQWIHFGEDFKWKDGYDTLVKHISTFLPPSSFLLGVAAKYILWELNDSDEVLVVTNDDRSFIVENVLVTVSVGCLQKWQETVFVPAIPDPMKTHLQGIRFGGSNKIFMGWPSRWWGTKKLDTRILWTKMELQPSMDWLYGIFNIYEIDEEGNILQAFLSGDYSRKMEAMSDEKVCEHFLYLLRSLFNRNLVPEPTFFRRTQWNTNPWTYGSYSSFVTSHGSKAGIHSRAPFRIPLQNKWNKTVVHWAGEHTHDTRYGTVDGALASGIREANIILSNKNS